MESNFKANFIYSQNDGDAIMVGFADSEFDTKEYILLQKSLTCDKQDKELGLDKVHIAYSDQAKSAYGGIKKFILRENSVEISIDSNTASDLGTEELIIIDLQNKNTELTEIKDQLEALFEDELSVFDSEI